MIKTRVRGCGRWNFSSHAPVFTPFPLKNKKRLCSVLFTTVSDRGKNLGTEARIAPRVDPKIDPRTDPKIAPRTDPGIAPRTDPGPVLETDPENGAIGAIAAIGAGELFRSERGIAVRVCFGANGIPAACIDHPTNQ